MSRLGTERMPVSSRSIESARSTHTPSFFMSGQKLTISGADHQTTINTVSVSSSCSSQTLDSSA